MNRRLSAGERGIVEGAHARVTMAIDSSGAPLACVGHMLDRVGVSRRRVSRPEYANHGTRRLGGGLMNTRTIAIVALAIAVVLLIIFLA
ncbi:MAG TPA: hypothetical protein VNO51_11910 [Ilumatobacteraceae bacterium]|nr:hypothetical protein [Ilumatobacteraceae bacterium]